MVRRRSRRGHVRLDRSETFAARLQIPQLQLIVIRKKVAYHHGRIKWASEAFQQTRIHWEKIDKLAPVGIRARVFASGTQWRLHLFRIYIASRLSRHDLYLIRQVLAHVSMCTRDLFRHCFRLPLRDPSLPPHRLTCSSRTSAKPSSDQDSLSRIFP